MDEELIDQRTRLIENNIASFLSVWKDFEGALFVNDQTKTQIVTGLQFSYMNSVVNTKFTNDVMLQIRDTLIPFIERKVPVLWWIGPNSQPDDLDKYLEKFGFNKADEPPGMYMKLSDLDLGYQYPPELRIEVIRDTKQVEDFTKVFVAGIGGDEERRQELLKSEIFLLQKEEYITFLGYWEDEPVATAGLVLDNEAAGVYLVITHPEYRGRKTGTAMTVATLKHAYELGYTEAILQSSAMGYNIYKRIGFEEYCKLKWYYYKFE